MRDMKEDGDEVEERDGDERKGRGGEEHGSNNFDPQMRPATSPITLLQN